MVTQRPRYPEPEPFAGLLLRNRGRTGLTQRELAARLGTTRRSLQDWESGAYYPSGERLQALILVLLEAGGLTIGREAVEARELWAAVLREAPRMHTPLDEVWLAGLLAEGATRPTAEPAGEAITAKPAVPAVEARGVERRQDWGEAPDVIGFVGRAEELATLREWVVEEGCRLAGVLGMGGMGKTALASRLAQDAAASFQHVYWRSLRDAPPVGEWMGDAIGFLSAHDLVPPEGERARLATLLQLLRDQPSLLVLDNFETVLEPGQQEGRYREGFAGYGALLQAIGESGHRSCLVMTSREAPPELAVLSSARVRQFQLGGLGVGEGQVLLADKQLSGNDAEWANLIGRFGGNGLALKVVGESIRQVFDGDIGAFLNQAGSSSIFGGIRRLLAEQIERSSALEQKLLRVLAVAREPVSLAELIQDLGPRVRQATILEAVEALRRRSLVERAGTAGMAAFTLQSVVLEYVTDCLIEDVGEEIERGRPRELVERSLIKAQAKDYVRQTQERLIGEPILQLLTAQFGEDGTEQRLLALLEGWRNRPEVEQGYGPGNIVNLVRLLRGNLRGLNLAGLAIRQAYLAEVDAQDASLVGAHLAAAVLAEVFSLPLSVALSTDGGLLAAGSSTGEVWLWRLADRTLLATLAGHVGGVRSIALSADAQLLASGGFDCTVRLWECSTGRLLTTLQGHTGQVWGVALSADGRRLASGSEDGTIRLWEAPDADADAAERWAGRTADLQNSSASPSHGVRPMAILQGHTGAVWSIAISADGQLLASGGFDGTVRLWEPSTGRLLTTLLGHSGGVWGVGLSADGHLLASGSNDGTARLWETSTGRQLATLQGHTSGVWGLALGADGRLLATASGDGTARLWETSTGRLQATLHRHTGAVRGVALAGDGLLASSGEDGTVRLWEPSTGRPLATLQGHTSVVRSVALSVDGQVLASGGFDGAVRLWEASTGRPLSILEGHTSGVWRVALAADGQLLASGSLDGTVRLWEPSTGRPLATLQAHPGGVWTLALSADGRLLASGGGDGVVQVWEARAGRRLAALQAHPGGVWSVALSADGQLIASSGEDGTVRLWETRTGRLLTTLQGHSGGVWSVSLSADGQLLASGSGDGTTKLWESPFSRGDAAERWAGRTADSGDSPPAPPSGGRLWATLEGHAGGVWGVALSADGHWLASGGGDGAVRLWDARTGRLLASLTGHAGGVWCVDFSGDSHRLASGSEDGTVRLWDTGAGTPLLVLRSGRRYEGLDVTGLTGVTPAQHAALLAMGAVEQQHRDASGDRPGSRESRR